MNNSPLWSLTEGSIEFGDKYNYSTWDEFKADKPWYSNDLYGSIPTFWKIYDPVEPDFDPEYDICCLGLVYTTLAPLRAYSVCVELKDGEYDEKLIKNWLIKHKFLPQRGG
jgi:hypothetical protein